MIVRGRFLHTFITGNLKYEKTPDKIYSEQPKVKRRIEELQKKAKEKSDKNTTYYVRVDGKDKTVTLESSPKSKNLFYHFANDVIKGPVIGVENLVEAERLTWTGHPIKGALKRLEGIGNIYGMYTLGLGSFLGDFADRYTPGELQYGTSEEVGRRQKTENLAVKLPTDILVSRAVNGFVLKQFKMNKAGNTVKESSNKVVSNLERESEWNIENKPLNYTVVKNSEGNYTLGRNNEWNFDTKYNIPYTETGNKGQGLVSVPTYNAVTNDYSRNYDVFYRTISETHYNRLMETGDIPPKKETSITQNFSYSSGYQEKYGGVTIEIVTQPGTLRVLEKIGVKNNDGLEINKWYPNMEKTFTGWEKFGRVQFKEEKSQITINLGKGSGLEIFNQRIKQINVKQGDIHHGKNK